MVDVLRLAGRLLLNIRGPSCGRQPIPRRSAARSALHERLEAWRIGTGGPEDAPDEPPPTEEKTPGLSPDRVATFPVFLTVMLAAMVCGVLGLSFDPKRGGVGWAAAVVTGLDGLLGFAPYWVYREPERGER
jgi:hypothetical protein